MAERLGVRLRHSGMRMGVLGIVLVLTSALAGCGDADKGGTGAGSTPSSATAACSRSGPTVARADLDGDGVVDDVYVAPAAAGCPATLGTSLQGAGSTPTLDWDPPAGNPDGKAVRVPGRTGDLVLLLEEHPRGGFQAHLFGYADGELAELTADGSPIFPFVATDALTDPISARCVEGGFEVIRARRHEPIGVVPAWDVDRATYSLDGNAVSRGATTEVADNVLDKELHQKYADLVDYSLFGNCLVGR